MVEPAVSGRDTGEEQAQSSAQEAQGGPILPPHHSGPRREVGRAAGWQIPVQFLWVRIRLFI